ncbi:hypothetical protein HNP81_003827 [Peribacillus huizhouensis]|uniref:Uncharacterized protein n=1 Tax=Peribacillus huizhouensis TaxID=1501239 RepID=A0ABR6CTZ4_9BACI|nr:hypothetical protein [Peribacillus huizhouensis]
MYDAWIYNHFIITMFFPVLVMGGTIIISAIFIYFVSRKQNNL